MRPTNDERREVAARLREKYREKYCPGVWQVQSVNDQIWMYLKDLEACLPDGYSAFNVLADLIEPEPERTCRNVHKNAENDGSNGIAYFECSECGCAVNGEDSCAEFGVAPIALYDGSGVGWCRVSYCPHCGARVIDADA